MQAGKEELIALEEVEVLQHQIWNDSCDVGVCIQDSPEAAKKVHLALKGLMELNGYNKSVYGPNIDIETFVMIEEYEGLWIGIEVRVGYHLATHKESLIRREMFNSNYINISLARKTWATWPKMQHPPMSERRLS